MFIFYFGNVSDLTPTVLAPVTSAGIAKADPWKTMTQAFMFVLIPAFLLIGSPGEIGLALVGTVTGHLLRWSFDWAGRIAQIGADILLISRGIDQRLAAVAVILLFSGIASQTICRHPR